MKLLIREDFEKPTLKQCEKNISMKDFQEGKEPKIIVQLKRKSSKINKESGRNFFHWCVVCLFFYETKFFFHAVSHKFGVKKKHCSFRLLLVKICTLEYLVFSIFDTLILTKSHGDKFEYGQKIFFWSTQIRTSTALFRRLLLLRDATMMIRHGSSRDFWRARLLKVKLD